MSLQQWRHVVATCKHQIYVSRVHDPFFNLSVEHYLLQNSPPHSTVLFLYVNRPCVVIGRNQNPWLEANLRLLHQPWDLGTSPGLEDTFKLRPETVQLVRRRSGGGAVFHDSGNVNFSVICPPADFTRDKHAEMVTKAIRTLNPRARVNERHDIVLDQGPPLAIGEKPDDTDMHRTAFCSSSKESPPLKVSGSAYKLTRQRSLHHGTCLVVSPNLSRISEYLHSPARPFLKARGVESVRSPIGNLVDQKEMPNQTMINIFQDNVIRAFMKCYYIAQEAWENVREQTNRVNSDAEGKWATAQIFHEMHTISEIGKGMKEIKSPEWLYDQTPQFTLSSHPTEDDDRHRPPLPEYFPVSARVYLKVKSGQIVESNVSISPNQDDALDEARMFSDALKGKFIRDFVDFNQILNQADHDMQSEVYNISKWLNDMFGKHELTSK
ncbi:hypothetical protein ACLMJK_007095 [Lecanora helva]